MTWQAPISAHWRPWLTAAGLAVGLWCAAQAADAKAKVTFSDTKDNGVRVDVANPSPLFQGNKDTARRGSSSLDGVGATPFAPSIGGLPGPMIRRDRDSRDNRSNWILEKAGDASVTEESLNRALGVRSTDLDPPVQGLERRSSFWEAFRQQPAKSPTPSLDPRRDLNNPNRDSLNDDPLRRYQAQSPLGIESALTPLVGHDRERVIFSDSPDRSSLRDPLSDGFRDLRRDLVRDGLDLNPGSGPSTTKTEARQASRAEEFRRILGAGSADRPNPTAAAGAGPSSTGEAAPARNANGLGSVDLVNTAPDPTRRELNPVIARPTADFGGSANLSFSDSVTGVRPNLTTRRPLGDTATLNSLRPIAAVPESELTSKGPARRSFYSPTALEMPRRGF